MPVHKEGVQRLGRRKSIEFYSEAKSPLSTGSRRSNGAFLVDGVQVADTMQCVHGGEHFPYVRGSGTERSFCLKCNGITCGHPMHSECVPFEQRLLDVESGKRSNFKDPGH